MIMAEAYNPSGTRARPYLTVKPLAKDLGLKVHVSWSVSPLVLFRTAVSSCLAVPPRFCVLLSDFATFLNLYQ